MHFDVWTFGLQLINFIILVWLLQRFLYRPVLRLLDQRRQATEQQVAAAAEARAKAEQALADLNAERAGIESERQAVLEKASAQAEKAATERRQRAEADAQQLLAEGRKTLEEERRQAELHTREAALDLGGDIARRLLAELPEGLRADAWLGSIEKHLQGLEPPRREALARSLDGGSLRVVTANELPTATRQQWQSRLLAALGVQCPVTFETDPALIAGCELHFPDAVLHFSWRKALAALREGIGHDDDAH